MINSDKFKKGRFPIFLPTFVKNQDRMARDDGKLAHLLGMLDESGWNRLLTFMHSPWFNRSGATRQFTEIYAAAFSRGQAVAADETLFQAIFPNEAFDALKLKNLKAAVQRKLDDFFAQEALETDVVSQLRLQMRQLNRLNEHRYIHKYYQKALEKIDGSRIDEEARQLDYFAVMSEWENAQGNVSEQQVPTDRQSAYHHAWQFFQLQTVKFLVRQTNLQAIGRPGQESAEAEAVLLLMDVGEGALPALRLYHCLLHVFREPAERGHFVRLRAMLAQHSAQLARGDASDIYTGAINHCIRRINAGEGDFATHMLELYKEMDDGDLLLRNGRLPALQFKNMVGLGLRFKEFEWAQLVIDRYGKQLEHDPHGNAEAFNQGMLYFSQGNFAGAERFFNQVLQQFDDIYYGLDARVHLLRVYYETGNWLGLESLIESFKMYLKRNKHIPKVHRENYLVTTRFFSKLAKLVDWDQAGLLGLRDAIEGTAFPTTSKQWLLQKINARLAQR